MHKYLMAEERMGENMYVLYSRSIFDIRLAQKTRFNELVKMAKRLNECCMEGEKIFSGFTNLIGDCWFAFFHHAPQIKEAAQQLDNTQFHFISNLLKNEDYLQWHELTKDDELLSVLTTIHMADQLTERLKFAVQNNKQDFEKQAAQYSKEMVNNKIAELQSKIQDSTTSAALRQLYFNQLPIYETRFKQIEQQIEQIQQQVAEQLKQLSDFSIGIMIQDNKHTIRKTKKAIMTMGAINDKKMDHIPLKEQLELAEKLSTQKELQKIADLVGRFKRMALKKQKTKHKQTMERKHITMGHEVSRLLPTELANYVLGHSKMDFLRRFSESQTFIFDTQGKERKGKGPIILCIDESSSMTSIKEQSKAFCMALLMIAKKQKRDFALIPFATAIGEVKIFRKGQATLQDLLTFSYSFLGGGTNYEQPLRESLAILLQSDFKEADVLFITDGSSFLSSQFIAEFNAVKKKKQFTCTAVVLTNLFNAVDLNVVNKFSDRVIEVNDLFEAEDAFVL